MIKRLEQWLRGIIKDELDIYFGQRPRPLETVQISNNETGADIIMPNYVKEAFDEGKVTSLKDII